MKQTNLTPGQRIDVYEILNNRYYGPNAHKIGIQRPGIKNPDSISVDLFIEGTYGFLTFVHTPPRKVHSKLFVDCKKVFSIIIKTVK